MLPFAWPTIKGPNFGTRSAVVTFLLPLIEGRGKGGNASAVMEEGLKSTKRHLWTDKVVVSPIDLIFTDSRVVVTHALTGWDLACTWHSVGFHAPFIFIPPPCLCLVEAPARPRVRSTQNEWKWPYKSASLFLSTTCTAANQTAQVGHVHRYF
jgi:hypothetical protein